VYLVPMHAEIAHGAKQHVRPECDHHDRDDRFDRPLDVARDMKPEHGGDDGGPQERPRVPDSPDGAHDARATQSALTIEECRDGRDVIGIERMAQAEQKPAAEGRDQRTVHTGQRRSSCRRAIARRAYTIRTAIATTAPAALGCWRRFGRDPR
jgi:hypothetical protein